MTPRQAQLLTFLESHNAQHFGVMPSFEEMRVALKLKSKSGIYRILTSLEERGFIRRRAHQARAIQLVLRRSTSAERLEVLVDALVETEGAEVAAAALLTLAEKIMPKAVVLRLVLPHSAARRLAMGE